MNQNKQQCIHTLSENTVHLLSLISAVLFFPPTVARKYFNFEICATDIYSIFSYENKYYLQS